MRKLCFPAEGSGLVKQTVPRDHGGPPPPFTPHQAPYPPLQLPLPVASGVAVCCPPKAQYQGLALWRGWSSLCHQPQPLRKVDGSWAPSPGPIETAHLRSWTYQP